MISADTNGDVLLSSDEYWYASEPEASLAHEETTTPEETSSVGSTSADTSAATTEDPNAGSTTEGVSEPTVAVEPTLASEIHTLSAHHTTSTAAPAASSEISPTAAEETGENTATVALTTAEPTSKDAATAEPTVGDGTTAEPTSKDTATAEPTIGDGTTAEPTSKDTATAEPTIGDGTTASPTTTEPTGENPSTTEPTGTDTTTTEPTEEGEVDENGVPLTKPGEKDKKEDTKPQLIAQQLQAVIYTDNTYTTLAEGDTTSIMVSGELPEKIEVRAFPIEIEIEDQMVLASYDITLFDAEGKVYEPETPVTVSFVFPEEMELDLTSEEVSLYHIPAVEEALPEVVETDIIAGMNTVEFVVEHFSAYVITVSGSNTVTVNINGQIRSVTASGGGTSSNPYVGTMDVPITRGDSAEINLSSGGTAAINVSDIRVNGTTTGSTDNPYFISSVTSTTSVEIRFRRGSGSYYRVTLRIVPRVSVPTVDSISLGVTMRLMDYQRTTTGGNDWAFLIPNGDYGDGSTKLGIVNNRLTLVGTESYPVVKNTANSLSRYFTGDTSTGSGGAATVVDGYKNVNHLFLQETYDKTGYLYFNSAENFAQFNRSTETFDVLTDLGTPSNATDYFYRRGNFMPFNTLSTEVRNRNLYNDEGVQLAPGADRYNDPLYGFNESNNFHFGMYIGANFYQPKDGIYRFQSSDGSVHSDPMRFDFTGDDDMWVFIDDVLVLDLGGIHDAQTGWIDFSTGEVRYTDTRTNQSPLWRSTTIKAQFETAYGAGSSAYDWSNFDGNTFPDYTSHTIKIFYMERGAGASNLKIKFNLATLPEGDLAVMKEVEGIERELILDQEFTLQLFADNAGDGNFAVRANAPYKLYRNEVLVPGDYSTDSTGHFTLKDSEKAVFSGFTVGDQFYVIESGLDSPVYRVKYEMSTGESETPQPIGSDGTVTSRTYTYNYGSDGSIVLVVKNSAKSEDVCHITVDKSFTGTAGSTAPAGFTAKFTLWELEEVAGTSPTYTRTGRSVVVDYTPANFPAGRHTFNVLPGYYEIVEEITATGDTAAVTYRYTTVKVGSDGTVTMGTATGTGLTSDRVLAATPEATPEGTTVYYINTYGPPSVDLPILKVDNEGEPLSGARFTLYKKNASGWPASGTEYTVGDGQGASVKGYVILTGLSPNSIYKLEETFSPAGFLKLEDPIYFKTDSSFAITLCDENGDTAPANSLVHLDNQNGVLTLVVTNLAAYHLPQTGSTGTKAFLRFGGALILFTLTSAALFIRSRTRKTITRAHRRC